jgi:hypothetical protein
MKDTERIWRRIRKCQRRLARGYAQTQTESERDRMCRLLEILFVK